MLQLSVSPLLKVPVSLDNNTHDTLHSTIAFLVMSKSGCVVDVSHGNFVML